MMSPEGWGEAPGPAPVRGRPAGKGGGKGALPVSSSPEEQA